ncbi:MAG: HAMP domain-containing histidine kinase [Firmicutes bacterium]|nr:HAMP domain-containing histidine kinase [Bacillota bacterium]
MDIKWKNYSHSIITKIIVFLISIICFSEAVTLTIDLLSYESNMKYHDIDIGFEDSYFQGRGFISESDDLINSLINLIEFKNEDYILEGNTITDKDIITKKEDLFRDFKRNSRYYKHGIREGNYEKFEEVYADRISNIKEELIKEDLKEYKFYLNNLEADGIIYYVSDGENTYTNSLHKVKNFHRTYRCYFKINGSKIQIYPEEINKNHNYYWIQPEINKAKQQGIELYLGFTDDFLNKRISNWRENKEYISNGFSEIMLLLVVFLLTFAYLIKVIGRKSFNDKEVNLNFIDKIYNDINLVLCLALIILWLGMESINLSFVNNLYGFMFPITLIISALGLLLILSLVKHIKNKTLIRYSLIYVVFHKIFTIIKDIYDSGSVGVKIISIVLAYPIIILLTVILPLTFISLPVVIGLGVWIALKKVKEFNAIKEGIEKIKDGDIKHGINVSSDGEFKSFATDINSITEGLNKAVENELKSERLKTELITNVSHDIRTPLTSIITYIDLLKKETDNKKAKDYIKILDQKSQRLKTLTDDLFEASKASSGNIPLNLEKIDIISLITQGLGELDDKIRESQLEFNINHPEEKIYIKADGKLLWRAFENLLSNILKYSLKKSRVYIDINDIGNEVVLTMKNISAFGLNISSEELMERFKRGDESRSSEGSGLGLSIAKSLIVLQQGKFNIEIDGDLFKVTIKIPKYKENKI